MRVRSWRLGSILLAVLLMFGAAQPLASAASAPRVIKYGEMEDIIKKSNVGVKIADYAVMKAKEKTTEYTDPHGALYNQSTLIYLQWDAQVAQAKAYGLPTDSIDIYFQSQMDAINRQLDSLGEQNEQLADAVTAAENARDKALAAQISAAKTLYITVHTIDKGVESARNSLEILKSQKERTKRIVDAGFAAASTLDNFDLQIDSINAQIATSVGQRGTVLTQLKSTLGLEMKDEINVGELPQFDFTKIDNISYSSDLSDCLRNNLDIKQKERTYKEIDAGNKTPTQVDITAARLNLDQAKLTAEVNFKTAYEDMVKSWTLLKEDRKSLADKRDKLAKAETQLSLGLIPASTVKNQKDDISGAEYALKLAEVKLALACQNYENLKLGY